MLGLSIFYIVIKFLLENGGESLQNFSLALLQKISEYYYFRSNEIIFLFCFITVML